MQEKKIFEYAIIRVVPRVEREEFVNAGIILFCKKSRFLQCRFHVPEQKLLCLDAALDIALIAQNLQAFAGIAHGDTANGPIASFDKAERFRWLTATRSTIIQCSKVHPGMGMEEQEVLDKLFEQFVL